jgi:hypothetical protein
MEFELSGECRFTREASSPSRHLMIFWNCCNGDGYSSQGQPVGDGVIDHRLQ